MRGLRKYRLAVGATALAMAVAGCGGGGDGGGDASSSGGELRVNIGEPEHLITTNTNESEGGTALQVLYTGLVENDPKTGEIKYAVAESVESSDQKVWTIKLKKGWKFHNGEDVNADAFIRAWTYGAYAPNAQGNTYFFDRIVGYDKLQSKDPDGEKGPQKPPEPAAKELAGLKKVDDSTLEVTLTEPFSAFPMMLGYTAYNPMAQACLDDIKACEEKPIGNGPFKMDGAWKHKEEIKLVRNDDYQGDKAKVDRLTLKIFEKNETAYQEFQAENLDILRTVPPESYAQAKQQYGERMIEAPSSSFAYIAFPLARPEYQNKLVRQAISMAIDREAIIKNIFSDRFTPAKSVVSPIVPGSREDACKYCEYKPDEAKKLLQQAGGWKGGKLELWFNAGAGHDKYFQAVGDQVKKNLGIDYALKGQLQFAEYLKVADEKKFTGPFRLGWIMDYPSPENYLKPLYGSQGSSNNTGYANPKFDSLMAQGDAASSIDEGIKFYQQAEDLVLEDLPVIPVYFGKSSTLFQSNVSNVEYNPIESNPIFTQITIKS